VTEGNDVRTRFAGQVVVVTGGGSGIGRAMARAFANEGARVVIVDRVDERTHRVATEIERNGGVALPVCADVSVEEEVEAAIAQTREQLGAATVLVNNASRGTGDGLTEIDPATWKEVLGIALGGAYLCTRAVLPDMIARHDGVVLNIASVNGIVALGQEAYSAAKAGLLSLTRSVAVRYGPHGIRCNALAPATIRTPAWDARLEREPDLFDRLATWYPLGRIGEADDVAPAALFICSREAAWISGVVLPIDGGLLAGNRRLADELLLREGSAPAAQSGDSGYPPGGEPVSS
jgi:meso-butanediol dehydrogenase/(S,S)-butanediol dehydrogenase/diacetyl reductase